MSRKNKIFALILALVFCLSMMTAVTVYADEEDVSYDTEPVDTEPYDPPSEDTEPPFTEPTQAPETEAPTQAPETQAPETQAPQTEAPETTYYQEEYYDYDNTDSYEERESNTSSEKAETAAVYDAEKDDVSTDTLKKGDWAKIAAQLKNANGDSADDFAFIRKNDAGGSNNGEWMLILGIALEALGLGTIIFLIVMKVRANNAVKAGNFNRSAPAPQRGRPSGPDNRRPQRQAPPRDERARAAETKPSKRSSKFDTADVVIPKRGGQSGGNRYKPKH